MFNPLKFISAIKRSLSASQFLSGSDLDSLGKAGTFFRPYEQSAWIMRAIQLKALELTNAPLKFYQGDEEYADPKLSAWWARGFIGSARRRYGPAEAAERLAAWVDLEGEYFLILGDDWLLSFPANRFALSPLIIARPDRVRLVVQGGELLGYVYTDGAGRQHALVPEQVVHRAFFNPYDDWRGLAPVKAVLNAADADFSAGLYVRNLMRNNGDQGVYVIAKGGVVDDAQREQVTATLRAKRSARLAGRFIPTFLTGDITIEEPKAQAPDAAMQATRIAAREEIFVGLGVPPSMAQVKATYSTGTASDRYQLITSTVIPLSRFLWAPLGELASRQAGVALTAEADWDDHPVMQEVRIARIDTALKLTGVGMPMEKANEYLDLGLPEYPGWDVGYLPFSVSPVDLGGGASSSDPAADPALAEPAADTIDTTGLSEAGKAIVLQLHLRRRRAAAMVCTQAKSVAADPFAGYVCACHGEGAVIEIKDRDPKQVARWRDLMSKRRETVRAYESRFGRELMKARSEVLAKIEAGYRPAEKQIQVPVKESETTSAMKMVKRAAAADLLFDLAKWKEGFLGSMRRVAASALNTAGKQLFAELGRDDAFSFPPAEVLEYARSRENKLSGVADEVHARITEELEAGITAGDTTEQLAARIRSKFNGIDTGRSRVIAMTETSAAYGQGRQQAMETAGIEYKQWLTSGNASVRATHAAANNQIVPIDGFYDVGGEQLSHPGDPAGSPENVINCHCVSIAVEAP